MSFEVIPTAVFDKELKELNKKYPAIKADIIQLAGSLKSNPKQGTPLGKDCFKIRIKITGKAAGKSGGARVISYVKLIGERVYLLSIYDKSDRATNAALNILLKQIDAEG